jgi:signal transduction histidine kinase/DNA-binding response OmpR family regulator/streptogramin lyase
VGQVSAAQVATLRFAHLTINDGLSQSSANDILQDHQGFLWVATQDGLNRFDGYRFEVMRHDADDLRSLSSNNISSVYEDSRGTIWVGTTNGTLHRFDRQSNSFTRFQLPVKDGASLPSHVFEDVRRVFESTNGRMWVGTRNTGLYEFIRESGEFVAVSGLPSEKVNSIYEGVQGELWIGTDQRGLLWFFPESGRVESAGHDEQVFPIYRLDNGEVWVAGSAGYVTRYRADRTPLATFSVRPPTGAQNYAARAITQDDDGRVWIGLIGGGLQAFTPQGVRVAAFSHSPSDPLSLSNDTVYSLLYDSAGVLWAGTLAAGLNKANLAGSTFTNYWHRPEDETSLSHNMSNEFAEDSSGALWIGTSGGGVNKLDPATGIFTHFRADPDDPEKLASDRIWGMYLENDDDLWVGTWGEGINKLDTETGRVERYGFGSVSPEELPGSIVTAIVGDSDGGIWIGMADGGLVRKRPGQTIFDRYSFLDATKEFGSTVNVASLFRDSQNRIWVGTWTQGLCVLDSRSRAPNCHVYNPSNPHSINDNNIRSITEAEDGAIWVATGNGIAKFDEQTNSFERFTSAHGLVEGVIYGIIPETSRILWLSSNRGLMRFDTSSGSVRKYDYKDGLQSNEFNGGAYLKGSDGTYYFGGIAGVSSFRPEELSNNPVPPQTVITRFTLFNEDVPVTPNDEEAVLRVPVSEAHAIRLNYDQNFFGFEFSGLHMVAPALNRYAHMLEGFDRDWVYSDADRRYANYTNLDPGDYVFRVRSANSDGLWSEKDAIVAISIAPPWWMTWWARVATLVALAMSILLIIRWRLSLLRTQTRLLESEVRNRTEQIRLQKETIEEQAGHLEEVLEAKNQFFARLSHEFRTPITLMLGPIDEQLRRAAGESANLGLDMARRNGRRLLHLVDQLLGLARFGGERPPERQPIAVEPIGRFVVESFGVVARARGITLTFEEGGETWISSNQDALQTILINLVSNAIKYTNAGGSARVVTMKQGTEGLLIVSDSGVGIAPDELQHVFNLFERGTAAGEGTGIGLTLVKEVVDAHGGSISIDSEVGSGTRVEIRMPLAEPPTRDDQPPPPEEIPDIDLLLEARAHDTDLQSDADDPERPSVLLIEDNQDMRQYVRGLLGTDYTFVQAEDGKTGLEVARETIPDLIICDVMMPELDGFEVLAALRDDEHTSHIPVIMLTALGDQASRLKGLEARADDYISKPFSRAELELKVRNLLELCRLRAQRTGQLLLSGELRHESGDAGELSARDRRFVARLADVVEARYQDPEFRLATLADAMFMSQRQLQRKMKAILDTVPASYLRNFRLTEARRRLLAGESVSDVTFATGFSSVSYFGKCFKARFGMSPSEVNAK